MLVRDNFVEYPVGSARNWLLTFEDDYKLRAIKGRRCVVENTALVVRSRFDLVCVRPYVFDAYGFVDAVETDHARNV